MKLCPEKKTPRLRLHLRFCCRTSLMKDASSDDAASVVRCDATRDAPPAGTRRRGGVDNRVLSGAAAVRRSFARAPLQRDAAHWPAAPSSQRRPRSAILAVPSSQCRPRSAVLAVPSSQRRPRSAVLAVPSSQCHPHSTILAAPSSQRRPRSTVLAVPSSQCRPRSAISAAPSLLRRL